MKLIETMKQHQFLFEELTARDFKQKYKRTALGMAWSILNPLLTLLVMRLVFTRFFGRNMEHYTTYLFAGNLMFSYFKECTNVCMQSLMANANIFTKINVPKYMFLFSKNVSAVINFGLTLIVFFVFTALDHVTFRPSMFAVVYPIITLTMLNIGRIFYSDFGLFYQVPQNSGAILNVTNVIDTYVYRGLLQLGDISMSSAAGLFQSVLGFIVVVSANAIVRKVDAENALF